MPETITITNWTGTFENAESRKLERLNYFKSPIGVDSSGYLELVTEHQEAGILAFGVFQALCQAAATFPKGKRGRFEKAKRGPMSIRQIAALIRMPENIVADAIKLLASQEVGWITIEESPNNLPIISQSSPSQIPTESQPEPEIPQTEERRGEEKREEESPNRTGTDCCTPDAPIEPFPVAARAEVGEDLPRSQQQLVQRVLRGLQGVNPEWIPRLTQMEMHDLSANLGLWAEIPRHYWLLLRWWYSRKRPALVRAKPTERHYPPADRAYLLRDTTRCLDAIADKWNAAGKPALEPREKREEPKPGVEEPEEQEADPLDNLSPEEFATLRKQIETGPLTDIDKAMMNSDNKALANEHVRMLMREALTGQPA